MSKILDLNVFVQETLDIRLPGDDGVIHLEKPTREMVISISSMQRLQQDVYDDESAKSIENLVLKIMNSNIERRVFEQDYVENVITLPMRMALIQAYSAWIVGIEKDPN